MVTLHARLEEAEGDQRRVVSLIAGNGSGHGLRETRGGEFSSVVEQLQECVDELDRLGVQVKDVESGLLDFPGQRHGEEVLLCWQVGEAGVAWWHRPQEGYAGRKPIDWGEETGRDSPGPSR